MSLCPVFEQATNAAQPSSGELANKRDATLEACFSLQPWCAAKETESPYSPHRIQRKDARLLPLALTQPRLLQ